MTNSNQLDFHEPTLQQVADLCSQFGFTCAGEADLACLRAVLREGFSRYGRPAPAPAEGEVGELVPWLCKLALERQPAPVPVLPEGVQVIEPTNHTILVPAPVPVAVPDRLPQPEDCDAEGRCWLFSKVEKEWRLIDAGNPGVPHLKYCFSHWLPAHALPLPSGEVEA